MAANIAYASVTVSNAERMYVTSDKELQAI